MQLVQWFVVMRLGQNAVSAANDQGLFDVGFATAQACLNVARMGCNAVLGRSDGREDSLLLSPYLTGRQCLNSGVVHVLCCLDSPVIGRATPAFQLFFYVCFNLLLTNAPQTNRLPAPATGMV